MVCRSVAVIWLPLLLLFSTQQANAWPSSEEKTKPNFLVILVDDMGFSDLGCYGGEIQTPNLDQLAKHGLQYTQFHNTGRCWPTRASLMTGYYPQQVSRDRLFNVEKNRGGGQARRPDWAELLPTYLTPAGYRSYHSGKWHIDGKPVQNGFEASYWLNDHGRFFSPRRTFLNDKRLPPVERNSGYYATTAVADYAMKQLASHQEKYPDSPFLQYVAFTAPHFPLHALPEDIAKYEGRYDAGWKRVRAERWKRIQSLGIVTQGELSAVDREQGPPYPLQPSFPKFGPDEVHLPLEWETLTEGQKKFQADKMEIHAAMVDRMDQEVGRILKLLKQQGKYEDTVVLFLSDNGASAEIMIRDDGHDATANPGSADTHLCLGPGWSTVSNTPFRKHKTWVHEGGTATPLIVHWPKGIQQPGLRTQAVSHVVDIVPTILELAGLRDSLPQFTDGSRPALPGRSLTSTFENDNPVKRNHLWWSHENHRALRIGEWKLVKTRKTDWELFDLSQDRTESNNLAAKFPDRVKEMAKIWSETEDKFARRLGKMK